MFQGWNWTEQVELAFMAAISSLLTLLATRWFEKKQAAAQATKTEREGEQIGAQTVKTTAEAGHIDSQADALDAQTIDKLKTDVVDLLGKLQVATLAATEAEMRLAHQRRQATEREEKYLAEIGLLHERVSRLEKSQAEQETKMKRTITDLKTENDLIVKERDAARAENAALRAENAALRADLEALRKDYELLHAEVQKLKAKTGNLPPRET